MSALDVMDYQDWLQDELRSLPVDMRVNLLVGAIRFNRCTLNVEEIEALNSTFELVKLIGLMAHGLSRANRFYLSNLLRDVADQAEHLPPKSQPVL